MNKFSLDYNKLEHKLTQKKSFLLADVQDKIEKVAWDVVRFRDNTDTDMLWKIEDSPEGPVIVALYEDDGSLKVNSKTAAMQDWSVVKRASEIHVFYKNNPVVVLNSENLGIPQDELGIVSRWLPTKLASDADFQAYILSKAGQAGAEFFGQSFPELAKIASKAKAIDSCAAFHSRNDLPEIAELITRD